MLQYALIQVVFIGLFQIYDPCHSFDVLSVFIFDDIQNIVNGDNPYQSSFSVDYRHGDKTVLFKRLGYFFLVIIHLHTYEISMHQVHNSFLFTGNYQGTQGHNPYQLIGPIFYIAGIDGFCIHPFLPDVIQCLTHSPLLLQTDEIRRHDTAGTVVRVVEEGVNQLTFCLRRVFQNPVYQRSRQFFQNVNLIVEVHFLNNVVQFRSGNPFYNLQLVIGRQVCKYVYRNCLRQQTVNDNCFRQQLFVCQKFFEHFCNVRFIVLQELVLNLEVHLFFKPLINLTHGFVVSFITVHD